jgi:hypothetical protein
MAEFTKGKFINTRATPRNVCSRLAVARQRVRDSNPQRFHNHEYGKIDRGINILACFANTGTGEARSLESGTQEKENELLCEVCNSSRAGASSLPSLPLAPGRGRVTYSVTSRASALSDYSVYRRGRRQCRAVCVLVEFQ